MGPVTGLGHSWQNVINANGITITIIGMVLVFFSLSLITLIISWTPFLLKIVNRFIPEEEEEISKKSVKSVSETEVVAAISAALCHSMQSTNKQA